MFDVLSRPNVTELQKMKLFADVSRETIERIVDSFVIRRLKGRDVLIAPDQPNHYLFLVLSGRLCVYLDATMIDPVCCFGPGEPIGELSVIDSQTTSAYVVADEDCRLLVLDEAQVWSLVQESHPFARNLLINLSERLRRANQFISRKNMFEDTLCDYGMLDALTGLHSRSWFDRIIQRALKRCTLQGRPFSVLLAGIDRFGEYNDSHGRMAGDLALHKIATTFRDHLRVTELAVRYGGDLILVILPETDLQQTRMVAERLRCTLMYTDIPAPGGRMLPPLTLSIGIAQAREEQTVEEFMQDVLVAQQRAREMGRNFVSD